MMLADEYRVKRVLHPHTITAEVPGSKSITNRALLIAALAQGRSVLRGVLFSDDSRHFLQALIDLGFDVTVDEAARKVEIVGCGGRIPAHKTKVSAKVMPQGLAEATGAVSQGAAADAAGAVPQESMDVTAQAASLVATKAPIQAASQLPDATVNVGSAGTAARFLTAFLGLSEGRYRMDASEQMKARPMRELLVVLEELGAEIAYEGEAYHFPYVIGRNCHAESGEIGEFIESDTVSREMSRRCRDLASNEVTIDVDKSSQFLSALLITSVLFPQEITIRVTGSHGMAYVRMTVEMMRQFGLSIDVSTDERIYRISAGASYQPCDYTIEPDLSAACYFYAAGAILGVPAKVINVHLDCLQGDIAFLSVLCDMGCKMREDEDGITLLSDGRLCGGRWDLSAFSDQALTLAAIAPFADAAVEICGISHIRYQECDRIRAILDNLSAMGVRCEEMEDGVRIFPENRRAEKQALPNASAFETSAEQNNVEESAELTCGKAAASKENYHGAKDELIEVMRMHGARIETYEDHRVAMAFTIPGLRLDGQVIVNPSCCRKTFEDFFEVLEAAIYEIHE